MRTGTATNSRPILAFLLFLISASLLVTEAFAAPRAKKKGTELLTVEVTSRQDLTRVYMNLSSRPEYAVESLEGDEYRRRRGLWRGGREHQERERAHSRYKRRGEGDIHTGGDCKGRAPRGAGEERGGQRRRFRRQGRRVFQERDGLQALKSGAALKGAQHPVPRIHRAVNGRHILQGIRPGLP